MFRLLLSALLVSATGPAWGKLGPSDPEVIARAVGDCWTAVGAQSIDKATLLGRGWQAGSVTGPEGKEVASPLQFYGRPGSDVVLMLTTEGGRPMCSVMSKVRSLSAVSSAAQAVQRHLMTVDPKVGTSRSGQSIVFISLPKLAMLNATGSKSEPAVRIIVSYNVPEKK